MLFVVSGSSASGKSTIARTLDDVDGLIVHDSDEDGVPSNADKAWRQRTLEDWVLRALDYQVRGIDMLLTGQSPLGEVLAAPSAPQLDAIAMCLLDVNKQERRARLEERDPGKWSEVELGHLINWGNWHRRHAADPRYVPEVITNDGWHRMEWERWEGWAAGDPYWRTTAINTTGRDVAESAQDLRAWIAAARSSASDVTIPAGWAARTSTLP